MSKHFPNEEIWTSVLSMLQKDKDRKKEIETCTIPCQKNQSLRYYEKVFGPAGKEGYSLFICMHGGGAGTAEMNDAQWKNIIPFEKGGFKPGTIAVAPRGITNTWNLHFVDETFPALVRLIENYIIFKNVCPNKVYLMGFSAGGDGTYGCSERIPFLLAACSPQGGHPNGIPTVNLSNLPMYLAVGEQDGAFDRNKVAVEYYKQIIGQKGKYLGNYIAKCEVVAGSGHSFQCWQTPRKSFFNGTSKATTTNDTAFSFMYSFTRNPFPTQLSIDVKTWLTPLRNYYSSRGNTFYYIEVGDNPPDMIQISLDFKSNIVTIKKGTNFKINFISDYWQGDKIITITEENNNSYEVKLEKDLDYVRKNMLLYCDPFYGFDSYVIIGKIGKEQKSKPYAKFSAKENNNNNNIPYLEDGECCCSIY